MYLRLCLLGALLIGLAVLVENLYQRLEPETTPIARGAAHAAVHRCGDSSCREELQGQSHRCEDLAKHTACADVAAYWRAVRLNREMNSRLRLAPDNPLLQGERIARERNCFRCHGELGQGGMANPGALKGYIPGYFGRDFRSLTDDGRPEIVREWIATGSSRALTDHPITGSVADYFLKQQAVSMPSFASLPAAEIELLTAYVIALNLLGSLDAKGVARYAALTLLSRSDRRLESLHLNRNLSTWSSTSTEVSIYANSPAHQFPPAFW